MEHMKRKFNQLVSKKGVFTASAICLSSASVFAQEAGEPTELADVVTKCLTWLTYGTTTYISLMGAAVTIVAGTWVYKKIKLAMRVA